MFGTADHLKAEIVAKEPEQFFEEYVLGGGTKHFTDEKIDYLCSVFAQNFSVEITAESAVMVGSAKLGFALHKKRRPHYTSKAFRPFGANSDIDLTICNAQLFRKIWYELSAHACLQSTMPWNPNRLGDYLTYGWLRPDKFPKGRALTYCDRFYATVGQLKRDRRRSHPGISVALYYSVEQLKRYQTRSIRACRDRLETPA